MVGDDEDGGGQRRSGGTDTQRCGGRGVLRGGHLHRRRLLRLKFHHCLAPINTILYGP